MCNEVERANLSSLFSNLRSCTANKEGVSMKDFIRQGRDMKTERELAHYLE